MLKWVLRGLVAFVVIVALVGLGYRAWRQHEVARALAIAAPNGIVEGAFVRIGGIDRWVTIRGEDQGNPVILMLHGGPGASTSALGALWRGWEKDFTVAQWDQPGAGRTYGRNGVNEGRMTVDRMARDGIELSEYLIEHLHKKKIILIGHSWGSELGVLMVKREPGLFYAYVGTGQVVAKEEKEEVLYARLMTKLRAAHDADGIKALQSVGPPPYRNEADLGVERRIQNRFEVPTEQNLIGMLAPIALYAPDVSLRDMYDFIEGRPFGAEALYQELLGYDARKLGRRFEVPVFVFNGDHDLTTPADLAKSWFDTIDAPQKEFVILKGAGHSAVMTMPDVFLRELTTRVRPIAMKS